MFGQAALSSRSIADQEIVTFNVAEMIGTFTKVNVGSGVLEGTSNKQLISLKRLTLLLFAQAFLVN